MKKTKKRSVRARRRVLQHKLSILLISGVVLILGITLSVASVSSRAKNRDLKSQEAELEEQLEAEKAKSEDTTRTECNTVSSFKEHGPGAVRWGRIHPSPHW